ncbi:MAG: ribonuclease Z [Desulfobacterales bacterium]|nr:ribonuclease Z [Desulfobacterales bacterium]
MPPTQAKTMGLTILGSGTCVPSLERSACSALVRVNNSRLLFDLGPGTMRRLLEADTRIHDVGYIFFSHFHPDHTGELVSFLFSSKYPGTRRRNSPLTIVAAKGFSDFFSGLKQVYGEWIDLSPEVLSVIEMDNTGADERRFSGFVLKSIPVMHRKESIAFRVENAQGNAIVYSGDTDYSENLIRLAAGADILICESALPDALKVEGHLTPSLAGTIASAAGVKKLVLTHFYPECDTADIEGQCRKTYAGPLVLARDLMQIALE